MRRAGVRWLAIGIESASERVRADVDKGYRPEAIHKAIGMVRQSGIHVMGNYIFGLPEDDHTTMRETLDFAKELNTEFANFFSAMAYPGSQLYRDAVARGWPLPASGTAIRSTAGRACRCRRGTCRAPRCCGSRDAAFRESLDRPAYRQMAVATFGAPVAGELDTMLGQGLARDHKTVVLPAAQAPRPVLQ